MGCNCRGGTTLKRPSTLPSPTPRGSLCVTLEAEGNNLTVSVSSGRLHLNPPFSSGLSVPSLLQSIGCKGSFARALLAADLKLMSIYSNSVLRDRFISSLPGPNLKLGFLRDLLRSF